MTTRDRLAPWAVGAFVVTVTLAGIYLAAQNLERSGADDAPLRLASQVLADPSGEPDRVELETSQAAFWVVYDANGSPIDGNGMLDGALVQLPSGVIRETVAHGTDHVTWQPRDGLRFATVETLDGDRVIMAGQSLAPSETRTERVGLLLLLGWGACMGTLAIGCAVHTRTGARSDR